MLSGGSPRWAGKARFVPEMLAAPLKWRKPQRVFVNSMSDLFHEDITDDQIAAVFGVMAACPQHTFQVLTKRPERMLKWFKWAAETGKGLPALIGEPVPNGATVEATLCGMYAKQHDALPVDRFILVAQGTAWPLPNVWIGVSTEDQDTANERVPLLLKTPAAVRFVSAEPLLGPINFCAAKDGATRPDVFHEKYTALGDLDWVIVGGESGPTSRQCEVENIRRIVRQCKRADVACFVKQLGSCYVDAENAVGGHQAKPPPEYGNLSRRLVDRKGGDMTEWPEDLCVREFPKA